VIEAEGGEATFQLDSDGRAVLGSEGPGTAMDIKEWNTASLRICDKLPAESCDAVGFDEGVCEERDAQWGGQRGASSSRRKSK
jgi:hypothetical protein